MPGYELFGTEELAAIVELFERNGGILFAHGFEELRAGVYKVREYESAFAKWLGIEYALAVSSGSAALKVALDSLKIGPGDEVITQAFTFVATVEAIRETGATPVIVDVDDTLGMNPASFASAITHNTKAVIPVHMLGEAVQMDRILEIAKAHSVAVLEDAAQALGASFRGRKVGTLGDLGAFSTDAYKTLNTGEGGLVVTNSRELFLRARSAHDHGHEYSENLSRAEEKAVGPGFNYRMTELQAAIGLVQLSKANKIVERQRANKKALLERLAGLPLEFRRSPDPDGDSGDAVVLFLPDQRRANGLAQSMIENRLHIKTLPNALRWHFAKHWNHLFGRCSQEAKERWAFSANILERSVAIPIMVNMELDYMDRVAEQIRKIVKEIL